MATGGCRIDEINQCLWHGGERFPLTPKVFAVLQHLSRHSGQLVLRQTLLDAIWPDTHVTEAVLTVAIAQLREALGDDAQRPSFIETVHRRGYRWIGQIDASGEGLAGAEAAAAPGPGPAADSRGVFGREREMDVLRRALASARAGKRQLVFVTGEPGIGKTALIDGSLPRSRRRFSSVAGSASSSTGTRKPTRRCSRPWKRCVARKRWSGSCGRTRPPGSFSFRAS